MHISLHAASAGYPELVAGALWQIGFHRYVCAQVDARKRSKWGSHAVPWAGCQCKLFCCNHV